MSSRFTLFVDPILLALVFVAFLCPLASAAFARYPSTESVSVAVSMGLNVSSAKEFVEYVNRSLASLIASGSVSFAVELYSLRSVVERSLPLVGIVYAIVGGYIAALLSENVVGILMFSRPTSVRKVVASLALFVAMLCLASSALSSFVLVRYLVPYATPTYETLFVELVWVNLFSATMFFALTSFVTALLCGKAFGGVALSIVLAIVIPLTYGTIYAYLQLPLVSTNLRELNIFELLSLAPLALLVAMIVRGWEVVKK